MTNNDTYRPTGWDEYIGQTALKRRLSQHIAAAHAEERPLDHTLLCGSAGLGKTSAAAIIATEMYEPMLSITLPWRKEDLRIMSRGLDPLPYAHRVQGFSGILFIDELHTASKVEQNELLRLMDPAYGELRTKAAAHVIRPVRLCVIAATTEIDKIITPLQDRFRIKPTFMPYTREELGQVVVGMAAKAHIELSTEESEALGAAAGGVPRQAFSLVTAWRSFVATGTTPTVADVLDFCQLEPDGLTPEHVRYLLTLDNEFRPVGEAGLASLLRRSKPIIVELEALLIDHLKYVTLTERGRVLTPLGEQRAFDLRSKT